MAQREGSIYLYLFVVALVLFFVMAAAFFFENAAKVDFANQKDLEEGAKDRFEADNRELFHKLSQLRVLVAGPSYSEDEKWPDDNALPKEALKEKAEAAINSALEDLGDAPRTYDTLISVYDDLQGLLLSLRQARDEAFEARSVATTELASTRASGDETVGQLRQQYSVVQDEIRRLQTLNEDLESKFKAEKASWVARIDGIGTELADQKITYERQLQFGQNRLSAVQQKLDVIQEGIVLDKTFENVAPDGQLLTVFDSEKGWINLGQIHHVYKGLPFRVFQFVKGGKKRYKGKLEVVKVSDVTSEVRILEEVDSLDPITEGDYITSPFYDPNENPVFVFAGDELSTQAMTRQSLEARMVRFGGVIQDKVDINTDFVVVLTGFESSSEYAAAKELGVTIIRDRELLEFVGR